MKPQRISASSAMPWAIGLVVALDYFDAALFAFFATYISAGVNASPEELVWASSAYALFAVLGILQQHAWVERIGYRRYLAICMFMFALGGFGAALCDNSAQLTLARSLQGYFIGPMLGACRILIQNNLPASGRPKALKSLMTLVVFGGGLAPILGAWLVAGFEWRWLFVCTAIPAVGVGLLVLWSVPDVGDVPFQQRTEPHHVAFLVFALAQAALQVVLTRTHFELFSGSPAMVGMAIAGLAGLGWFAVQQWTHPAPIIRMRTLQNKTFQVGLALYVVYYYLSTAFSYLLPRLMEGGYGYTVSEAGYLTGTIALVTGLPLFVYLRYASRLTRKKWLIVAGFGVAAVAGFWMAHLSPEASEVALVGPLVLRGLLMLFIVLPVANLTFRQFAGEEFAHGYRLKNLMRQLAMSFATSSVIALQQHRLAVHEVRLSETTTPANANFMQAVDALTRGFEASGHAVSQAHAMALGTLQRLLEQQATFMASMDGFTAIAAIALAAGLFAAWQRRID
ncbi:MFS transporter [Variovorax sp. dw_308]|uniref:MFS transporter n=1 Tax=Variovorax sp. dw_308 TaxID=2721546 RepID=UPI001C48269C|nr:MFS transporter [Variovorax sp. dw_308]